MTLATNLMAEYWRQNFSSRLPSGYREVEYLESTGVQWIDTGYSFTGSVLDFRAVAIPRVQTEEHDLFGSIIMSSSTTLVGVNAVAVGCYNNMWFLYSKQRSGVTSDGNIQLAMSDAKQVVTTTLDKQQHSRVLTVDVLSSSSSVYNVTTDASNAFCLLSGGKRSDGSGYCCGYYKLFSASWLQDNVLVRSFIPCIRLSDMKPGMYDLCGSICSLTNSPFYINSGTGADFTWGELQ